MSDTEAICLAEYDAAFPLVLVFPETPTADRVRGVLRELAKACFPGSTAAEADGRARELSGGKVSTAPF